MNNKFEMSIEEDSKSHKRKLNKPTVLPKKTKQPHQGSSPNHPHHKYLSCYNQKIKSTSQNELNFDLAALLDESSDSSVSSSSLSSLEEFNEDGTKPNLASNRQLREITARLKDQARTMNANIRYSNTYKDVITSMLNENLLEYAKQYDLYLGKREECDMINKTNQVKNERKLLLNKSKKLAQNVNMIRKIKLMHHPGESSKTSMNDDYVEMTKIEVLSKQTTRSTDSVSSQVYISRDGLNSKVLPNMVLKSRQNEILKSNEKVSLPQIRPSDLVLKGYEKAKLSSVGFKDEFFSEQGMSGDKHFQASQNIPFLTPSFKIKKYNVSDLKQLSMAKQDIFQRYNTIIKETQVLNNKPKSSIPPMSQNVKENKAKYTENFGRNSAAIKY